MAMRPLLASAVLAVVCGRPGAVTCCRTRNGTTRCRVRRSVEGCNAIGGVTGSCHGCCELCNPACASPTTTTTLPAVPCDESAPTCDGACPTGMHCSRFTLGSCGCLPDNVAGCGDGPFPACGGVCPSGLSCQAVHAISPTVPFNVTLCQCVAAGSSCAHFLGGTCPGACPPGKACTLFAAGGPPECSCTDP